MLKKPALFIVEDEPLIAVTIETALTKHGFNVLGIAENFEDAKKAVKQLRPDLVLLDIRLEGDKDGIDLALLLDSLQVPYLFLTSQTDPHTIDRVKEVHPLGFIVKPFTESGLLSNIELGWHHFLTTRHTFLIFKSEGQTHKVHQKEIKYLKAFDNYCYVFTRSRKYLVPKTLKHTAKTLTPSHFVKSHRSYIVNVRLINSVTNDTVIVDGEALPLSAPNKESIKQLLA